MYNHGVGVPPFAALYKRRRYITLQDARDHKFHLYLKQFWLVVNDRLYAECNKRGDKIYDFMQV